MDIHVENGDDSDYDDGGGGDDDDLVNAHENQRRNW